MTDRQTNKHTRRQRTFLADYLDDITGEEKKQTDKQKRKTEQIDRIVERKNRNI